MTILDQRDLQRSRYDKAIETGEIPPQSLQELAQLVNDLNAGAFTIEFYKRSSLASEPACRTELETYKQTIRDLSPTFERLVDKNSQLEEALSKETAKALSLQDVAGEAMQEKREALQALDKLEHELKMNFRAAKQKIKATQGKVDALQDVISDMSDERDEIKETLFKLTQKLLNG